MGPENADEDPERDWPRMGQLPSGRGLRVPDHGGDIRQAGGEHDMDDSRRAKTRSDSWLDAASGLDDHAVGPASPRSHHCGSPGCWRGPLIQLWLVGLRHRGLYALHGFTPRDTFMGCHIPDSVSLVGTTQTWPYGGLPQRTRCTGLTSVAIPASILLFMLLYRSMVHISTILRALCTLTGRFSAHSTIQRPVHITLDSSNSLSAF